MSVIEVQTKGQVRHVEIPPVEHAVWAGGDLWVTLRWNPSDPFAVRAVFQSAGQPDVEWVFSRQLLADGIEGAAGEGDVRILPGHGARLSLVLAAPEGRAVIEMSAYVAKVFLYRTIAVTPLGEENIDRAIDTFLQSVTS